MEGNVVNSSDEELGDEGVGGSLKNSTVLHFRRKPKDDEGPSEDEFYRYDSDGKRVNGHYDAEGFFIVDINDRDVAGRCNSAGFMLDEQGRHVQDFMMGERISKRAYMLPQPDELYRDDLNGIKVSG